MRRIVNMILFLLSINCIKAQQGINTDSLRAIINNHKGDTAEVDALANLGNEQERSDSGIKYAQQGLSLAEKINYAKGKADCLFIIGNAIARQGNFGAGIQYFLDALSIYNELRDNTGIATVHLILQ